MINTDIVKIENHGNLFQLTWTINNICTNHCRYCPQMLHQGQNHHYEWQHVERFSQELFKRKSKIMLSIAGGEPTVSPWLKDLINLFRQNGHWVGVTSNGVRQGSYWDDGAPNYICLSYHAEFETDKWATRAIETQKRIENSTARIMMDPQRWDQCERMYSIMKATKLGVEAVRILDWGGKSTRLSYSPEQLEWLTAAVSSAPKIKQPLPPQQWPKAYYYDGSTREATGNWANQLINQDGHYFTGWQCDIGLDSLFVQYDGSYRRGNCSQGGYLGRLQDTILSWPQEPVICQLSRCHCTTDIITAKRLVTGQSGPHPVQPAA